MGLDDIARYLAEFGAAAGAEASTRRLISATGGHVDLRLPAHRVALIEWLRAWGNRHLRRADTARTADSLGLWWEAWATYLPDEQMALTDLSQPERLAVGQAYDALRVAPAAARNVNGRDVDVSFGDTATAKALYAIRPQALVPWDEAIRLAFGRPGHGAAYARLLQLSAEALDGLARRLSASVSDVPALLGRPGSSPPKLVDEFLWIRITEARLVSQSDRRPAPAQRSRGAAGAWTAAPRRPPGAAAGTRSGRLCCAVRRRPIW